MNTVDNVSVKSVSCALPKQSFTLLEYAPNLLDEYNANRLSNKTGFNTLRIAPEHMTASDLIVHAAEPLLNDVERDEIGAVIFVSKTQDYALPATSHLLQTRLHLNQHVLCLDINEGCSGYVKGLYTASLLAKNMNRPVLLTAGDTSSRLCSPNDRATRCIFGDAGIASLIAPTDGGGDDVRI